MSAPQPETPLLEAWYLVTPGGLSSVKIIDGLAFREEESGQGKELALATSRSDVGLIRFQVDELGSWLSVCNSDWQISGSAGPIQRPIPLNRPIDLKFRQSVVHLRTDFSKVDCDRVMELSIDRVLPPLAASGSRRSKSRGAPIEKVPVPKSNPRKPQPARSRRGGELATNQVSVQRNPSEELLSVVEPLSEPVVNESLREPVVDKPRRVPVVKKIPGKGLPSSLRLAPEPAHRNIPLLTERVEIAVPDIPDEKVADKVAPDQVKREVVAERGRGVPSSDRKRSSPLVADVPVYRQHSKSHRQSIRPQPQPQRTSKPWSAAFLLIVSLTMVSTDVPVEWLNLLPKLDGPLSAGTFVGESPSPAGENTPTEAPRSESSQELVIAIEDLLDQDRAPDAVTLQFVADAYRAIHETGSETDAGPVTGEPQAADESPTAGGTPASGEIGPESVPVAPGSVRSERLEPSLSTQAELQAEPKREPAPEPAPSTIAGSEEVF